MLFFALFFGCANTSTGGKVNNSLTNVEKTFVGTWKLKNITYLATKYNAISGQFETTLLSYPSTSNTFNRLCEQYLGKTILILGEEKAYGDISGSLFIGSKKTNFKWSETTSPIFIKFSPALKLSIYDGNSIQDGSAQYALNDFDKEELWIYPSTLTTYIFAKT